MAQGPFPLLMAKKSHFLPFDIKVLDVSDIQVMYEWVWDM